MTWQERLDKLHPDIIRSFLQTRKSDAIPEDLQRFIILLDKVPEIHRKYPSVSRCARELMNKYPEFELTFNPAREIIWEAINYFHLNSTVRNQAWNNYYADKLEELSNIAVALRKLSVAEHCLKDAAKLRFNPNENLIDVNKLKPIVNVLSPEVTWQMLGGTKELSLKEIAGERLRTYREALKEIDSYPINSEEKEKLKAEAALSLNIVDVEAEDE
jgi:hypothetical protein